jgi:hypothetical protein
VHHLPAFPGSFTNDGDQNVTAPDGQIVPPGATVQYAGMTLRDFIAAQVLAQCVGTDYESFTEFTPGYMQSLAATAYLAADEALRVRGLK